MHILWPHVRWIRLSCQQGDRRVSTEEPGNVPQQDGNN